MTAILLPIIFCSAVLVFLMLFSKAHRIFMSKPILLQVAAAEDSFQVWRKFGLHGRILVIIDRHLNADIDVKTDEFYADEFPDRISFERCCTIIQAEFGTFLQPDFSCTIENLNSSVIKNLVFYPSFVNSRLPDPKAEITTMAGFMAFPARINAPLPSEYGKMLPRMNRVILNQLYPDCCPQLSEYPVTATNYVHQAVRSGVVRKVYHLISDRAWNEVSDVLGKNDNVSTADSGYRIFIFEGVPVRIMPVQKIMDLLEPPLVVINTDSLNRDEISGLPQLLKRLRPDVVTISGEDTGKVLASIEAQYAATR